MARPEEHPSNRLSQGRVSDFAEALELVEQEHAYERMLVLSRQGDEPADDEELRRMDDAQAQLLTAVRHARRIWDAEQERARVRAVEWLRDAAGSAEAALDDEASRWLELLATALETGDYTGLAI
jgi:hypothetical protein